MDVLLWLKRPDVRGREGQHGHAQTELDDHAEKSAHERALRGPQGRSPGLAAQKKLGQQAPCPGPEKRAEYRPGCARYGT